jgi:hypothetical protein
MSKRRATLLGLPRELRDLIYQLAIPSRLILFNPYKANGLHEWRSSMFVKENGIFFTNRQLRSEALAALARPPPTVHITASEHALMPPLRAQEYTFIRENLQTMNTNIRFHRIDRDAEPFMQHLAGWVGQDVLTVGQHFPRLRTVCIGGSWSGVHESIMFESVKRQILSNVEKTVIGDVKEKLNNLGWSIQSSMNNPPRWNAMWSVTILFERDNLTESQ